MLLVVGAKTAIVGTAFSNVSSVGKWDRSRLVELAEAGVCLGIAVDQCLERAAIRASLDHEDLVLPQLDLRVVLPQHDLRVDHSPALRANAARQFVKDVVRVFLRDPAHRRTRTWD